MIFKVSFPVPKHGILKNGKLIRFNRKTNKSFIGKNDSVIYLERFLVSSLVRTKEVHELNTIESDISVCFKFYFPKEVYFTKKGLRSRKLPDLSNLYELPQDCMIKAGIILDDTLICSHDGSRRLVSPDENYYLEIIVSTHHD